MELILQLKKVHEMTHPTMQGRRKEKEEPEATEEELLSMLESGRDDES